MQAPSVRPASGKLVSLYGPPPFAQGRLCLKIGLDKRGQMVYKKPNHTFQT